MNPKKPPKQQMLFIIALTAAIVLIIPVWLFGWQKNIKQTADKQIRNENLEQKNKQMENLKTELEDLKNAWNNGLMDLEKQIDGLDKAEPDDDGLGEKKLELPE